MYAKTDEFLNGWLLIFSLTSTFARNALKGVEQVFHYHVKIRLRIVLVAENQYLLFSPSVK